MDKLTFNSCDIIDKKMYLKKYNQLSNDKDNIEEELNKVLGDSFKVVDLKEEFKKFLNNIYDDRCFISLIISSITFSEDKDVNIFFRIKDL